MQGANSSFLTRMQDKAPNLYVLKCYCHTFHLVARHACETISKSSEQLLHDVYNYFKNSPKRRKSFQEFQHFLNYEPLNILKPCQTRWLSVSECVTRVQAQWKPLEMFFTTEVNETKHPQAERILQSIKSPYMQATLEFMQYVLGDLSGLNMLFQSKALAKLGNIVGQHSQIPNVAQMLSSLATVTAGKFIKKFVARMFEHAQTFFGNICCSAICCPVWPHCRATIHHNFPSEKNQLAP